MKQFDPELFRYQTPICDAALHFDQYRDSISSNPKAYVVYRDDHCCEELYQQILTRIKVANDTSLVNLFARMSAVAKGRAVDAISYYAYNFFFEAPRYALDFVYTHRKDCAALCRIAFQCKRMDFNVKDLRHHWATVGLGADAVAYFSKQVKRVRQ